MTQRSNLGYVSHCLSTGYVECFWLDRFLCLYLRCSIGACVCVCSSFPTQQWPVAYHAGSASSRTHSILCYFKKGCFIFKSSLSSEGESWDESALKLNATSLTTLPGLRPALHERLYQQAHGFQKQAHSEDGRSEEALFEGEGHQIDQAPFFWRIHGRSGVRRADDVWKATFSIKGERGRLHWG